MSGGVVRIVERFPGTTPVSRKQLDQNGLRGRRNKAGTEPKIPAEICTTTINKLHSFSKISSGRVFIEGMSWMTNVVYVECYAPLIFKQIGSKRFSTYAGNAPP